MLEVYVQQMEREQPQVKPWQVRENSNKQATWLIADFSRMLGQISIKIGKRLVQWGETLRIRNENLAPRVYPR